jgi:hypothetical protein
MNRIATAIARMEKQIADRIEAGITTAAKVAATGKTLDMDMTEYAMFQNKKSLAVLSGKLTLEEEQTIYAYLGETPARFNRQPVHVKAVLTSIFQELLAS